MESLFNFNVGTLISIGALLGTVALLGEIGVALVILLWRRNGYAARWVAMSGAAIVGTYLAVLAGVSLASDGRVVEMGETEHVCEIGCHLAYSVVGARRVDALGGELPSRGAWQLVTVRVRFDPSTTPADRGDAPPHPDPRAVRLVDAEGNRYAPSEAGLRAMGASSGARAPLTRALRPGESYETTLVFDVPAGARSPALLLAEPSPVARLLIGHERSLLRAPALFRLDDSTPLAGSAP